MAVSVAAVQMETSETTFPVALFTSKRGDWRTPPEIIACVRRFFGGTIALDPCASSDPAAHFARVNYTEKEDGLHRPWLAKSVYVNPPYGRGVIDPWVDKFARESFTQGILLAPVRTDTQWYKPVGQMVCCYVEGRLKFDPPVGMPAEEITGATFPSVLAYRGPRPWLFARAFANLGFITAPYVLR